MARVLMPLPAEGFDPSEAGIPWRVLSGLGHEVVFASPEGTPAVADPRMVTGQGLGLLAPMLRADRHGRDAYAAMIAGAAFGRPIRYEAIGDGAFDAVLLPGGHAKGMRVLLESALLQQAVAGFFAAGKPVGAICHGVVLAARARDEAGKSVLFGRRTTSLLRSQEMLAWSLTRIYLGDYYRTYKVTVEDEVTACLRGPEDFLRGPMTVRRDTPARPDGFAVIDGNYVSARWPGDSHAFAKAFAALL